LELLFVNNPPNVRFSLALPVALAAKLWPCLRLLHVIICAKEKNRKRLPISSEVGETFHFFNNNHQTLAIPAPSHQHEKLLRQAFGVSFNFRTSSSRYSLFQRAAFAFNHCDVLRWIRRISWRIQRVRFRSRFSKPWQLLQWLFQRV
jgi:hypothetical protein